MQHSKTVSLEELVSEIDFFHSKICALEERSSGRILYSKGYGTFWGLDPVSGGSKDLASLLSHLYGKIRNYSAFAEPILLIYIHDPEYFDTLFSIDGTILRFFWKPLSVNDTSIRVYFFEVLGTKEETGVSFSHPYVGPLFYELPEPAFVFDPDSLRFLAVNDAAVFVYGYSRKEFFSMTLIDIRPEDDRVVLEAAVRSFVEAPGIRSAGIWRHWRKDRKLLYMKLTANRISFGDSYAVLALLRDVSEFVDTSYSLKQSLTEKQSIIESMSDRYFSLSRDWRFISVNRNSEIILGKPKEELIGRNLWGLFPGPNQGFFKDKYETALRTGKPVSFEYKSDRSGEILEFRIIPFGEGLSVFFQDVTEKKRREKEQEILKEILFRIPKAATVKDSFGILFEIVCTRTLWSFAQLWKFRDGELILEEGSPWYASPDLEAEFGKYRLDSFAVRFLPGEGMIGRSFDSDRILFFKDIRDEDEFKRKGAAKKAEISSWISIPFKTGHESYVLEFCTRTQIDSGHYYIQMFELIADQVESLFRNKENEDEKNQFFKSSGDMFQISRLDGTVIERNSAWETVFGYSADELKGMDLLDLVHPEDREKMLLGREGFKRERANVSGVLRYVAKNGDVKSILWKVTFSPEYDLIYATGKDITEIQRNQVQLENLTRELKRSNADLEDFAFIASHDLQEPLRKIMAFGDRLLKKTSALDPESTDYIQRMSASALRLSNLIEGLLSYSRIKSRSKPFQFCDLSKILRETIGDLEIYIKERNAKVFDAEIGFAWCDPVQIGMVFQNLIKNGIKFNKNEVPEVVVRSVPHPTEPNRIRITFFDNGIGFDKKHEEKIFTLFQRLHSREDYEGNGIGLAVCKKIVELHGGRIFAESVPGVNSVFYVDIPGSVTEI
ncbi:PAS domain S-box protein [Leptospira gomenensis]|uniref:histidine kinase n=1 Tax=Leptospira gomenensis TaxID=2484974 RepID=A0A5F1Z394_9LEPT|nr:PAS domain S-box protein [Leptospira gomenensis]TGK29017.1 PAS domain S-box protein [Leptospira gomenensis]TGK44984.1 PAS domain S-box protein [Leptospira gomenensis]TGK51879.1 PAS domain S-box protein [Leptospira gomenensis]TGK67313.1 PAS domain S-box protein [Leptospira gomenensis]